MIFSHFRLENFSLTIWMTFHWRGITSNVSVISSPSFDSLCDPQQGQFSGAMTMLLGMLLKWAVVVGGLGLILFQYKLPPLAAVTGLVAAYAVYLLAFRFKG